MIEGARGDITIVIHHSRRARMHLAPGHSCSYYPHSDDEPLRVLLGQVLAKPQLVRRGDQSGRRRGANDCDIDSARLVVVAREKHEFQGPHSGATAAAAWAVSSQSAAIALAIGASASCTAAIAAAYAAPPPLIARVTQCRCFVARSVWSVSRPVCFFKSRQRSVLRRPVCCAVACDTMGQRSQTHIIICCACTSTPLELVCPPIKLALGLHRRPSLRSMPKYTHRPTHRRNRTPVACAWSSVPCLGRSPCRQTNC